MVKARKYTVHKNFDGFPKKDDYKIVEYELPPLKNDEVLVKAEWISVDPYLRAYHSTYDVPYDQFGFQVGTVQESKDSNYPKGTRVVSHKGWCDYSIVNTKIEDRFYKLPDLKGLSPSLAVGAIGMPGATAYFSFLQICKPKPGETVVVSGAAGAVGSLVGQIAKIKGCKVIGITGSDDKIKWLVQELGFDKAINYKTADITAALKEAAPNGIDCYLDNVGGEISSQVIYQMNEHGRIAVVGSISSYNDDPNKLPKATVVQPAILFNELNQQGFIIWNWFDRWNEAFGELVTWMKSGQLKPKEHITEGFENLFEAFIGMLNGENYGKAVVKV